MIGNVSFTIEADPDDKKELFKMFSEKGVSREKRARANQENREFNM